MQYQLVKMSSCGEHTPSNKSIYRRERKEYLTNDINFMFRELEYHIEGVYKSCSCKVEIKEIEDGQKTFPPSDE